MNVPENRLYVQTINVFVFIIILPFLMHAYILKLQLILIGLGILAVICNAFILIKQRV